MQVAVQVPRRAWIASKEGRVLLSNSCFSAIQLEVDSHKRLVLLFICDMIA